MRNSFSGFYGISEDSIGTVFTSENTIFIFDANILLTLYRCEEETRNRFFEIWGNIKEQCWFPHQVCLEYQRNRLKVVKDSRDALEKIPKKIKISINELKTQFFDGEHNQTISRYSNLKGELNTLFSQIDNIVNEFSENHIDVRKNNIDFLKNHDVIRDKIDELTEGRIGSAPQEQSIIDALNKSGKIRYKYKTGPGFEDSADKKEGFYSFGGINYDAEYGDYYVWSQILEYVSGKPDSNVVYVSNDAKSDFYYKIEGKIRGPNESLRSEIKEQGAAEFLLQNVDTFLHHANNHLNARIDENVITELTNASATNVISSPSLKYFKNRSRISNYLSEINQLDIESMVSADQIYPIYSKYQQLLISYSIELENINDAPLEELESLQGAGLMARKEHLALHISRIKDLLDSLGARMTYLQEVDAIEQLRQNE
ncbi:PIN-like domain-containing protein [Buttiauxella sp. S04-F03]|uniref:PIN-like domain-containing protein n=1 Tax=Buttiauxella sp. S04-F03 TaxID=2904525 RepID=UPI001E5155F3|nr:PIN-like domain-containing protein [Buttiauxella sp. S04-F03]MCE0812931.1 PIN domain-containing protein [Buttiauxella sp. S04-F03]